MLSNNPSVTVTDWEGKAVHTGPRWCSLGHLTLGFFEEDSSALPCFCGSGEQLRPVGRAERMVEVRLCRHTEENFRALV